MRASYMRVRNSNLYEYIHARINTMRSCIHWRGFWYMNEHGMCIYYGANTCASYEYDTSLSCTHILIAASYMHVLWSQSIHVLGIAIEWSATWKLQPCVRAMKNSRACTTMYSSSGWETVMWMNKSVGRTKSYIYIYIYWTTFTSIGDDCVRTLRESAIIHVYSYTPKL